MVRAILGYRHYLHPSMKFEVSMLAMNIKTNRVIEFTSDVSPQYAVAYGYCEDEGRLNEFHEAMRLPQPEHDRYFDYLGVMTGSLVVSCGDWRSEVEQYANPTEQDAFYSAELITSNQRQTILLVGTKKQVKHRLIMESKGNNDLIYVFCFVCIFVFCQYKYANINGVCDDVGDGHGSKNSI